MENDLLAYLEAAPTGSVGSSQAASVEGFVAAAAATAQPSTDGRFTEAGAVTHALIHQVASGFLAQDQDVQYLPIRNALKMKLGRPLTASEKDVLSTYILRTQQVSVVIHLYLLV